MFSVRKLSVLNCLVVWIKLLLFLLRSSYCHLLKCCSFLLPSFKNQSSYMYSIWREVAILHSCKFFEWDFCLVRFIGIFTCDVSFCVLVAVIPFFLTFFFLSYQTLLLIDSLRTLIHIGTILELLLFITVLNLIFLQFISLMMTLIQTTRKGKVKNINIIKIRKREDSSYQHMLALSMGCLQVTSD